jgi:rhamnosyltransferase
LKKKFKKNHTPKIAVLLAAYNGAHWIEEQVKSILNQKHVKVDIYISVDKSKDNTFEICKFLEKKNKSIKLLSYGKRYGRASKNFFRLIKDLNFDKYDYVSLSDQDDIWLNRKLIRAITILNKKKVDAFSSDCIAFWKNGKEQYIKKSYPQKKFDYLYEAAGPGCTYVFDVVKFKYFQIFLKKNWISVNKVFLHDWMIYAFYRNRNFKWYIDNISLIKYRQHLNNEIGTNYGIKPILKRINLIKIGWYKKEVKKIQKILGLKLSSNFLFKLKNFNELRRKKIDYIILLLVSILGLN